MEGVVSQNNLQTSTLFKRNAYSMTIIKINSSIGYLNICNARKVSNSIYIYKLVCIIEIIFQLTTVEYLLEYSIYKVKFLARHVDLHIFGLHCIKQHKSTNIISY